MPQIMFASVHLLLLNVLVVKNVLEEPVSVSCKFVDDRSMSILYLFIHLSFIFCFQLFAALRVL